MKIYTHKWRDHDTVYINDAMGFCKVSIFQETGRRVGVLNDLIVYPEVRGTGFGDKLIRRAISTAKMRGCDIILLWPDCEDWVKNWYSRNGFSPDPAFVDNDFNIGWVKNVSTLRKKSLSTAITFSRFMVTGA